MNAATASPRPLSVLHVIDTGGTGGAETIFCQLAAADMAAGHSAVTVIPREGWLCEQLLANGLQPQIIPARGSLNVGYLMKLLSLVRAHRPSLIVTHLLGSTVYGGLLSLITGIPVIGILHGPTDFRNPGRFVAMKRWLLGRCSALVAVSTSTRDALIDFGVSEGNIELVANGVDTDQYVPGARSDLRDQLGIAAHELIVGAVGNIRTPKAYDVLLRAAAMVVHENPRVHFAVVGDGNEKQMQPLLALLEQLGLRDRFRFLGFRKSSAELFHNFDIFVSSSRSEGLSLSFLEAMATARAIVATRSGGPQEALVDGRSGLLVPTENPAALAQALLRVAADPALRAELGAHARARVESDFSLAATLQKYRLIYGRLVPAFRS